MYFLLASLLMAACPRSPAKPITADPTPPERWEPSYKEVETPPDGDVMLVQPLELGGGSHAPGVITAAAPLGGGLLLGLDGFGAALYDPRQPTELRKLGLPEVQMVAADPAGTVALVANYEDIVGIDIATGKELWLVPTGDNAGAIVLFPDGGSFVVALAGRVERRDAASGAVLWTWKADPPETDNQPDAISALAVSPDGKTVFSHSYNRVVALAAMDGAYQKDIAKLDNYVGALAVSPDGKWLLAGGWDQASRLVRVADGKEILNIPSPGWVTSVAWSPDGTMFATRDIGGHIELRSVEGVLLGKAQTSEDSTSGLVWLASGQLVSWASDEAFTVSLP